MTNEQRVAAIEERLHSAFQPDYLKVLDQSHLHKGHEGAKSGKGHFRVEISEDCLPYQQLLANHRAIHQALDDMMEDDIHALQIKLVKSSD